MSATIVAALPMSRPSSVQRLEYDPVYCDMLVAYFNKEPFEPLTRQKKNDFGEEETIPVLDKFGNPVLIACPLPTMAGFASLIGVSRNTLLNWCKKYPDFREAKEVAEAHQERILTVNTLHKLYDSRFAGMVAKNLGGWVDKVEHSGDPNKPLIARIVMVPPKAPETVEMQPIQKEATPNGDAVPSP